MNAYVQPLVDRYISHIDERLQAIGFGGKFYIMTSGGGVATAERAMKLPISTILSGPAGGVAAAIFIAGVLVGADSMSRGVAVPTYIADVSVAVSLVSMLVATLFARYRLRWT
jgi:hypothetical protein